MFPDNREIGESPSLFVRSNARFTFVKSLGSETKYESTDLVVFDPSHVPVFATAVSLPVAK